MTTIFSAKLGFDLFCYRLAKYIASYQVWFDLKCDKFEVWKTNSPKYCKNRLYSKQKCFRKINLLPNL